MKIFVVLDFWREKYFKQDKSGKYYMDYWNSSPGKYLKKALTAPRAGLGLDMNNYTLSFAYSSIPEKQPSGAYKKIPKKKSKPYTDKLLDKINECSPDLILSFGSQSLEALTGKSKVRSARGIPQKVDVKGKSYWMLALYGTDSIMVDPALDGLFKSDIQLAKQFVTQGEKAFIPKTGTYKMITDYAEVCHIFDDIIPKYKYIAMDFESNTLVPELEGSKPIFVSLSWKERQGVAIPLDHDGFNPGWTSEQLKDIYHRICQFVESDHIKIFHNGKYDIRLMMSCLGLTKATNIVDTLIMYYIGFNENEYASKGLKVLSYQFTDMGGYEDPLNKYKDKYLERYKDSWLKEQEEKTGKKPSLSSYVPPVNTVDGGDFNYEWIPIDIIYPYAAADTDCTLRIFNKERKVIDENPKWKHLIYDFYPKLIDALAQVEHNGLHIDMKRASELLPIYQGELDKASEALRKIPDIKQFEEERLAKVKERQAIKAIKKADRTAEQQKKFKEYTKYNGTDKKNGLPKYYYFPSSGNMNKYILYEMLGYRLPYEKDYITATAWKNKVPEEKLKYTDYKCDAKAALPYLIEKYDEPIAKELINYSALDKAVSSFLEPLPKKKDNKGLIHCKFSPTGTVTGRLNSSSPNFQQLPRRIADPHSFRYRYGVKSMFNSRFKGGVMINIDYKSLEVYIVALLAYMHYPKDTSLVQALLNNVDVHKDTATKAYDISLDEVTSEQRKASKAVIFGKIVPLCMVTCN